MTEADLCSDPLEVAAPISLASAVRAAERLRDLQGNDVAAARELDLALQRSGGSKPEEHAYALLVRMELAEHLHQVEQLDRFRRDFEQVNLSPFERERLERRLAAATSHDRAASGPPAGTLNP